MHDALGVLTSCRAVVASSQHVRIDDAALEELASEIAVSPEPSGWDSDLHYRAAGPDADERTAMWLLILDALNFCFWPQGLDWSERWRVCWKGELVDGYVALVAALTRAVENGYPLHDARWLAEVSDHDVAAMLTPAEGHDAIPLLEQRIWNLRELGACILTYGDNPATAFIRVAHGSAVRLVQHIVSSLPSFNDVAVWQWGDTGLPDSEVRFYKRAQILVGDLAGGLAGSELARFHDLDQLTAFADYKVPQLLRARSALVYEPELSEIVDNRIRIPSGDRMELEIRAATIVVCDRLVTRLRSSGRTINAAQLDWHLWSLSQQPDPRMQRYHLTETIYY